MDDWFINWSVDWLIDWLIYWFIDSILWLVIVAILVQSIEYDEGDERIQLFN